MTSPVKWIPKSYDSNGVVTYEAIPLQVLECRKQAFMERCYNRSFGEWLAHRVTDAFESGVENTIGAVANPLFNTIVEPEPSDAVFIAKGITVSAVAFSSLMALGAITASTGVAPVASSTIRNSRTVGFDLIEFGHPLDLSLERDAIIANAAKEAMPTSEKSLWEGIRDALFGIFSPTHPIREAINPDPINGAGIIDYFTERTTNEAGAIRFD